MDSEGGNTFTRGLYLFSTASSVDCNILRLLYELVWSRRQVGINNSTVNGTTAYKCLELNLKTFYLNDSRSMETSRAYAIKRLPTDCEQWKHLN